MESNSGKYNDLIKESTDKFHKDPHLIDIKTETSVDSSIHNESPKEQEMEALLSEINALKSKSAMRRSDENKRTSEEIVHLYEENCMLSAKIEVLNRSLDKKHIQNVSLKEENKRHKCEKKRLHTLLKAQNKVEFFEKINNLEKQNIELLNEYQDVLDVLKTERENYAEFLKFIFLKILGFKCFVPSKNQILSDGIDSLENNKGNNFPTNSGNMFLVRFSENSFIEEKSMRLFGNKNCVSSRNESTQMVENRLLNQSFFRDTCDATILCKLESNEDRVSFESKSKRNFNQPLQRRMYKKNENINSDYTAASTGDFKPSTNLQKIIVLIRLYKEKFHNEFKKRSDLRIQFKPSSELEKSNKCLEDPLVSKPRCKTAVLLRKENRVNLMNQQIIHVAGNKKESTNNVMDQQTSFSKIKNVEMEKELETVSENSILKLNVEKRKIPAINYFESHILGNDVSWNNMIFKIQLDEVFSTKFQDPLIVNNLPIVNSLEFMSSKISFPENMSLVHTMKKNHNDLKKLIYSSEEINGIETVKRLSEDGIRIEDLGLEIEEENSSNRKTNLETEVKENEIEKLGSKIDEEDIKIAKNDSLVDELDSGVRKPNSTIGANIVPKQPINKSLSAFPIAFSPVFEKSRKIKGRAKKQDFVIENSNLKTEKRVFRNMENNHKFEKKSFSKKLETLMKDAKMERKNKQLSNTMPKQKRISRSLSADRCRFPPTILKLKKETEISIAQESKIDKPEFKILEIEEKRSKSEEHALVIKEEKCSGVEEFKLKIEEENIKVEKKYIEHEKQDLVINEKDSEIIGKNLEITNSCLKIEEKKPGVQKQNIENETLDPIIGKQGLKFADQNLEIVNQNLSALDIKFEKEIEPFCTTLLLRNTSGTTSEDRIQVLSTTSTFKKISEKSEREDPKTEIVFIAKISQESMKEIRKQAMQTDLKIFSEQIKIGESLSKVQSHVSSIQESSREKSLNLTNLVYQKKIIHTKTIDPTQVLGKNKKKLSKRIQTSEIKLQKIKAAKKVKSSSKNLNKKRSNPLCKKYVTSSNVLNCSLLETKPGTKEKLELKKTDSLRSKKKEIQGGKKEKKKLKSKIKTEPISVSIGVGEGLTSSKIKIINSSRKLVEEFVKTNKKVDVSVFTGESAIKRVLNEKSGIISNRRFEWVSEGVRVSSKSISIQSMGNVEASQISLGRIVPSSRSRQLDQKEKQLNSKTQSKKCKKEVYRVGDCIERSRREGSLKGDEFIRNIQPSRSELSERVSDCEGPWEVSGSRKCSQMSQNSGQKQEVFLGSDTIEGTEQILTSLTKNEPEIWKNNGIKIELADQIWTDEISKIEAWNIRVRDYLKQVRMKLLEEEKALEKERLRLRHRRYSPGDLKELML